MRNTDYISDIPPAMQCRYNSNVECVEKDICYKCGWNPVVAEARLAKIGIVKRTKPVEGGFGC